MVVVEQGVVHVEQEDDVVHAISLCCASAGGRMRLPWQSAPKCGADASLDPSTAAAAGDGRGSIADRAAAADRSSRLAVVPAGKPPTRATAGRPAALRGLEWPVASSGAGRSLRRRCSWAGWILLPLLGLAACSASDPDPSPRFDGTYAGTRDSDRPEACGTPQARGTAAARIAHGRVTIPLFGPRTVLTGTVGEDGTVRASGIWANPTGGFPGMTVLNGTIEDDVLAGTASDFRCHTTLLLRKTARPRAQPRAAEPRPGQATRHFSTVR
jgi:hypothetical protein